MTESLFSNLPQATEPSTPPGRKWLIYSVLAAAGLLALLSLPVLFGPRADSKNDEIEEVDAEELAKREERRLLEQLVENSIQPSRLGSEADESTTAQELNRWWLEYGPGSAGAATVASGDLGSLQSLLGDDAATLAMDESFTRKDVAHLATALSFRLAGLTLTTGLSDDREKVTQAFYFIVRNMQVVLDDATLPATFPYQAMLWGRGRGEDRVWAFVELLRQIRIDGFVVVPADDENGYPLVAVAIDEGVLLYDPMLGLPIPSLSAESDDGALPMMAATFKEALDDDAVFRQLDATDAPYPWTSDDLRNIKLLVVGADPTFAPRMEALQQVLTSQPSFVTFDGWNSSESRDDPLEQRIEAVAEQLDGVETRFRAWLYPLVQAATYDDSNGLDGEILAERIFWLKSPTVKTQQLNEQTQEIIELHVTAAQTMQDVRSMHIQADFDDAMRGYLPMRSSYQQNQRSENRLAVDLATYWSAICQFEMGRPDLSIPGLEIYLRGTPHPSGNFTASARYWLAVSECMNHQPEAALETLQSLPNGAFPQSLVEYLSRRWTKMLPESPAEPVSDSSDAEPDGVDL